MAKKDAPKGKPVPDPRNGNGNGRTNGKKQCPMSPCTDQFDRAGMVAHLKKHGVGAAAAEKQAKKLFGK